MSLIGYSHDVRLCMLIITMFTNQFNTMNPHCSYVDELCGVHSGDGFLSSSTATVEASRCRFSDDTATGARCRGDPLPTSTSGVLDSISELSGFSCILFCFCFNYFFALVFCFIYMYDCQKKIYIYMGLCCRLRAFEKNLSASTCR